MAKRRVYSNPIVSRVFETLVSTGIVYLLTPQLQSILAPVQAQLNANALNAGATPPNAGLNAVANTMVQLNPVDNPTPTTPVIQTAQGPVAVQATVNPSVY